MALKAVNYLTRDFKSIVFTWHTAEQWLCTYKSLNNWLHSQVLTELV